VRVFRRLLPAHFHVFSSLALDKLYDVHHQYANHDHYHITGRYILARRKPRAAALLGSFHAVRSSRSRAQRRNIHYGWVVAATTFLTMLVTAGAVGAPGVFILPLQREFGWQTSDISSALAVRLLLFGLMVRSPPP